MGLTGPGLAVPQQQATRARFAGGHQLVESRARGSAVVAADLRPRGRADAPARLDHPPGRVGEERDRYIIVRRLGLAQRADEVGDDGVDRITIAPGGLDRPVSAPGDDLEEHVGPDPQQHRAAGRVALGQLDVAEHDELLERELDDGE